MKTYEQKFKALNVANNKYAKDDKEDIILALGSDSSDAEWKEQYDDFIKEYPDTVPVKKKIAVKKTGKKESVSNNSILKDFDIKNLDEFEMREYNKYIKTLSKKDALQVLINNVEGDYSQLSPKLKRIAEKQQKQKTKPSSDLKEIKAAKAKAQAKKEELSKKELKKKQEAEQQRKIAAEKAEIEKQLKKIYDEFDSADPIKKMELAVTRAGVFKVRRKPKEKRSEPKAKRYGERMQKEHDNIIAGRAGKVARPALVELTESQSAKKENAELIKAADQMNDIMTVISSDIDDHLMNKNTTEVELIVKGFKALVIAAVSHENLTDKYKNRPKALKALENLGFVNVEKDKKGTVTKITVSEKIKPQVDKIRKEIKDISKAVKFAKGGKIEKFMAGTKISDCPVILKFHIGRGGRHNNQGHVSFVGEETIAEGGTLNDLDLEYEGILEDKDLAKAVIEARENGLSFNYDADDKKIFSDYKKYFKDFTFEDLGEPVYYNSESGVSTGLTKEDADSGIGSVNLDYDYDTTYTVCITDISPDGKEYNALKESGDLVNYIEQIIDTASEKQYKVAEAFGLIDEYLDEFAYGNGDFFEEYDIKPITEDEYYETDNEKAYVDGKYYEINPEFKDGGKIGFDKLAKKVSAEYQKKGYSKKESDEIGIKTAAKVRREKAKS